MNDTDLRYFLAIDAAEVKIHRGPGEALLLPNVALGPNAVPFKDRPYTLGSLIERLIHMDLDFIKEFDERLQIVLGEYLYDQTFGKLNAWDLPTGESPVEVTIVTADEHMARLPWPLLAHRGIFLCATGWSVALAPSADALKDCEVPPHPRLLIVAPEPSDQHPTRAQEHLKELEELLSTASRYFKRGKHLEIVSTWEDLKPALDRCKPDLLYYYGHGKGNQKGSQLLFATGPNRTTREVAVIDFAHLLRRAPADKLLLAYINCCQGDAGGLLGAGRQIGTVVPAVVTNRTIASIPAARAQACELWRALLLRGETPHQAVAGLYRQQGEMELTFGDARWMTPVLHRRYGRWQTNLPPRLRQENHDLHWRLKLDRSRQTADVTYGTREMLRNRNPRTRAYFWYGEEGQGVDLFQRRLRVEFQDAPTGTQLYPEPVNPRWPDDLRQPFRSFQDMMVEAFQVESLEEIPLRIRTRTPSRELLTLVYVAHPPILDPDVVQPSHMRDYLEWWDTYFVPLLREASVFGLLGVSFIHSNPAKLARQLNETLEQPEPLELRDTMFIVLDELEEVVKQDLAEFLHWHGVHLPRNQRQTILEKILDRTGGRYEMTLEELKNLLHWPRDPTDSPEEGP